MNSFYTNSFTPDDVRRFNEQQQRSNPQQQNDAQMGLMDPEPMSTHQPADDYASDTSSAKGVRRQSLPLSYGANSDQMNSASLRRLSMMNFGAPSGGDMNHFAFDPALNSVGMDSGMDSGMSGAAQQNKQQQQQDPSGGLSLDTQYSNQMNFNNMQSSNSATFPSSMNMDLNSPYLNSAGGMQMSSAEMEMMNNDMMAINDMFNAQQFGSPILNSPMAPSFGQQLYAQQNQGASSLNDTGQLLGNQASGPEIPVSIADSMQAMAQQRQMHSNQSKMPLQSQMPPALSNSSKIRSQNIGGRPLPWTEPAEGWPSTMPGAKSHMQTPKFQNVYAPSGFDLMTTLV
jgi:hypothetical protein